MTGLVCADSYPLVSKRLQKLNLVHYFGLHCLGRGLAALGRETGPKSDRQASS